MQAVLKMGNYILDKSHVDIEYSVLIFACLKITGYVQIRCVTTKSKEKFNI